MGSSAEFSFRPIHFEGAEAIHPTAPSFFRAPQSPEIDFDCTWDYKNGWTNGPPCPHAQVKGIKPVPLDPQKDGNLSAALTTLDQTLTRLMIELKEMPQPIIAGASAFVVYDQQVWLNKGNNHGPASSSLLSLLTQYLK